MITIRYLLAHVGLTLLLAGCATVGGVPSEQELSRHVDAASRQRATAWFEAHRHRPTLLRTFIQRMPKGGDIHTHVSGAVYAESYIAWAAEENLCVVRATGAITPRPCTTAEGKKPPIRQAYKDDTLYNAIVDALSTRNLAWAGRSGHDQFFAAFTKFDGGSPGDRVAELSARAATQSVIYVEAMLTLRSAEVRERGRHVGFDRDLAAVREKLLAAGLRREVEAGRRDLDATEARVNAVLQCQGDQPQPRCLVTRRYLQQSTRTGPLAEVYAQLVYAFELVRADKRVVGLNLVGPEDHPTALYDYTQHMEMLGFLAANFPEVNIALHAGELTLGLVPPEDLRFHIHQAVHLARAKRIGHGVDISYENDALQLMSEMRRRGVLVEICLTSNDIILRVQGAAHPFPDYLQAGVPVTLATDDEGISRIDLSHEYWRAATTYGLRYEDLKTLARNSLTYSFLAGASLWQSPPPWRPVDACAGDVLGTPQPSPPYGDFLGTNERAQLQWRLEQEFLAFEQLPWLQPE